MSCLLIHKRDCFLRIKLNVVGHNFRNFNLFIILIPTSNEQYLCHHQNLYNRLSKVLQMFDDDGK